MPGKQIELPDFRFDDLKLFWSCRQQFHVRMFCVVITHLATTL
jgi:hypothetical protein